MNTRKKGRRNELRCKKILEAAGYDVQMAPNPSKWSLQNDLFGLWDLIAVKRDHVLAVQSKTNQWPNKLAMEAMELWPCPDNWVKEVWRWNDGNVVPIIRRI